jgi:NADP-dependent alcohol dehydrogenase
MQNFTFYNPTRLHYGKDQIAAIKGELAPGTKVMMLYGGTSIKKNGVYDQVMSALSDCTVTEFSGIEANPDYDTCMKAVAHAKKDKVEFLLAVGGGSVIDATKFIAAAIKHKGDAWELIVSGDPLKEAMPLGAVLTLSATGSESNCYSVISRRSTHEKRAIHDPKVFPKFAVVDPSTMLTVPVRQVINGVVDAYVHTIEQYLTYPVNAPLQDRFSEGILSTLIEEGPKTLADLNEYDARANTAYCATMALNLLTCCGVPQDWTTHQIGHEITALHGLDHAQTLAIVLPAVMQYKQDKKREKLLQYGERVFNITSGPEDKRIQLAIEKTRLFFESLGIKTHLSEYGIDETAIEPILKNLERSGGIALGEHSDITLEDSRKILALSP